MQSSGEALTARFNALASRFDEIRSGINSQLTSSVNQINTLAQQIATLNGRILVVQQNPVQPPNEAMRQAVQGLLATSDLPLFPTGTTLSLQPVPLSPKRVHQHRLGTRRVPQAHPEHRVVNLFESRWSEE